jgi:hypothetical protein
MEYAEHMGVYNKSFVAATAASMPGVLVANVQNITISSGDQLRRRLQTPGPAGNMFVHFNVITNEDALTYSVLQSELSSNVSSGIFGDYLRQYGTEYGATGLIHASSTLTATENLTPVVNNNPVGSPSPGPSGGGLSRIVGVIIGIACALIVGGIGVWIYLRRKRKQVNVEGVAYRSEVFRTSAIFAGYETDAIVKVNDAPSGGQGKAAAKWKPIFYVQENPLQSTEAMANSTFGAADHVDEARL